MFNSGISANDLVEGLAEEIDISLDLPKQVYADLINSLEQLLYTEIIKEQGKITLQNINGNIIDMALLNENLPENEADIRFEDIYTIFMDKHQLIKSTLTSGNIFCMTWYKNGEDIGFGFFKAPRQTEIIYYVKPKLKSVTDDEIDGDIMLPIEFIDLAKAKLRGEIYKLANEDNIAAKWLNDYNILLENFKVWIDARASQFGM